MQWSMTCQLRHLAEKPTTNTIQGIWSIHPDPQHFSHTKSMSSAIVMYPGIREAQGLGREQGRAKTGVSGTSDFLAVLRKLIVETALSKRWVRGNLGSFDDQQAFWGKGGKHCHRIHLCRKLDFLCEVLGDDAPLLLLFFVFTRHLHVSVLGLYHQLLRLKAVHVDTHFPGLPGEWWGAPALSRHPKSGHGSGPPGHHARPQGPRPGGGESRQGPVRPRGSQVVGEGVHAKAIVQQAGGQGRVPEGVPAPAARVVAGEGHLTVSHDGCWAEGETEAQREGATCPRSHSKVRWVRWPSKLILQIQNHPLPGTEAHTWLGSEPPKTLQPRRRPPVGPAEFSRTPLHTASPEISQPPLSSQAVQAPSQSHWVKPRA